MGAKPSVPEKSALEIQYELESQKSRERFYARSKENFFKHFDIVPYEDLVVGRKYFVFRRVKWERQNESNYPGEPIKFVGYKLRGDKVFLRFQDRPRPFIAERDFAIIFHEFREYKRDDITIFQSRDTLAAQQAARGLAERLPEDAVHKIKGFLIGEDRENRYPSRGLQDYTVDENYFKGGLFNFMYRLMG